MHRISLIGFGDIGKIHIQALKLKRLQFLGFMTLKTIEQILIDTTH